MRGAVTAVLVSAGAAMAQSGDGWDLVDGQNSALLAVDGWELYASTSIGWEDGMQAVVTFWREPDTGIYRRCIDEFDKRMTFLGSACYEPVVIEGE